MGWVNEPYEITAAPDVDAVVAWARATVGPHRLFTLYAVVRDGKDADCSG